MFRIMICAALPSVLIWTFVSTFWREMKQAVWHAWNDCRIELNHMHHAFKAKSLNPEDWK
jgi:hypothetical protein